MKVGFDTFRETGNAKSALIDAIAHLGMILSFTMYFVIFSFFSIHFVKNQRIVN